MTSNGTTEEGTKPPSSLVNKLQFGAVATGTLERAARLEELPIDSIWTGGHVASRNPSTEAMMSLARLSAVTERVKIGTAILLLPLYAPAIVAKQIADLDNDTGGRLVLGVGVGGSTPRNSGPAMSPSTREGGGPTR
jgi:alkanesulfonate monooxygenase SsuD/methylene tetrahydromethanopterin reductase-like flavin-dependent oxidoreductase (luciferase family)